MKKLCRILVCLVLAVVLLGVAEGGIRCLAPEEENGNNRRGQDTIMQTDEPAPPETTEEPTPAPTLPPLRTTPATIPVITAQKAFVYDSGRGEYLYLLGEAEDKAFPASITKLFCAWVALQHLDPETVVTAGEELDFLEYLASTAGLEKGDSMSVEKMVQCLILPSGCDAAYVLAVSAGRVISDDPSISARDAVAVFVEEMNRQAKELGMVNTHFATPDGYHRDEHYISLDGFRIIAEHCLENPTIAYAANAPSASVTTEAGRVISLKNLNEILNPESEYYRSACRGLKTGRTNAAGACMLAAYWVGDRYIIVGVFGSSTLTTRYSDANALFDAFMA